MRDRTLGHYYPELTGDGAGGLYAFFPSTEHPSRVSTIRRETARIGPTWDTIAIEPGSTVVAWAFARWGGDFYVVLTLSSAVMVVRWVSEMYRLDPETGEIEHLWSDVRAFMGAGVSTCAPLF